MTITISPLHMQCQTAVISDNEGSVSGVIEFGVKGQLLIWENEFKAEGARRKRLLLSLAEYLNKEGYEYEIYWGESRVE